MANLKSLRAYLSSRKRLMLEEIEGNYIYLKQEALTSGECERNVRCAFENERFQYVLDLIHEVEEFLTIAEEDEA